MRKFPDMITWKVWDMPYEGSNAEFCPTTAGYQVCPCDHSNDMFLDHYLICCVQNGICQFYETSLKESKKTNGYTVYPGESFLKN